jgi:hypothetical protein
MTQLEFGKSFLQVKFSLTMKEKLWQVRSATCMNRGEVAQTRLEAVAGANNPCSLITIFRQVTVKAGDVVYNMRCTL